MRNRKDGVRVAVIRAILILTAFFAAALVFLACGCPQSVNVWVTAGNGPAGTEGSGTSEASFPDGGEEALVEKSVDLNAATAAELESLPGVGPALARRIVEYREENGGFYDVEELKRVQGVGERTFRRLEEYVYVG